LLEAPGAADCRPFARSRDACLRVASEVLPAFGGGNSTPARRALDSPMAMACLAVSTGLYLKGWACSGLRGCASPHWGMNKTRHRPQNQTS
jgi:hypothetical protein